MTFALCFVFPRDCSIGYWVQSKHWWVPTLGALSPTLDALADNTIPSDIDPDRLEKRQRGIYQEYTIGTHWKSILQMGLEEAKTQEGFVELSLLAVSVETQLRVKMVTEGKVTAVLFCENNNRRVLLNFLLPANCIVGRGQGTWLVMPKPMLIAPSLLVVVPEPTVTVPEKVIVNTYITHCMTSSSCFELGSSSGFCFAALSTL